MAQSGLSEALRSALGAHFEAFVAGQVLAGHYRDETEVLRAALALLESADARLAGESTALIRDLVAAGEASGIASEDPAAFFDRLRARYADPSERSP